MTDDAPQEDQAKEGEQDPGPDLEQASLALAEKIMSRLTGFHGFAPEDAGQVTAEIAEQLRDLITMTNAATTHALVGEMWNWIYSMVTRFNELGRPIGHMCDAQVGPVEDFRKMALEAAARGVVDPSVVSEAVRPVHRPKSER